MVRPYHEIVLGNNKEQTTDTLNYLDGFKGNYAEQKRKSQSQKVTYRMMPFYITFLT